MPSMQENRCPFARDKLRFRNYVLTLIHTDSSKKDNISVTRLIYDPAFD